MHHIISDAWSIEILNKELKIFYEYEYSMVKNIFKISTLINN